MARFRVDQEGAARATWEQILALPESPWTYRALRELASMHVREGDLPGAQRLYREAERRAPPQDRAEISSRLGWLAKETGNTRQAGRYFARSRGGSATPVVTYALIAVTSVVSLIALEQPDTTLFDLLALDKRALANGEYWRLLSVTLLHANLLHLLFNMYALYLAGSVVEQLYGWRTYFMMYVLAGAAGSVGSFVFGGNAPSVGASGAIFGLFGVLLAVSRTHHPVLDRRGQMLIGQMGGLIAINLVFSFLVPGIDISAHIGGLIAGIWLGFLLVPGRVPTLGSLWQRPANPTSPTPQGSRGADVGLRLIGVLALVVVIAVGVAVGTQARHNQRPRASFDGAIPAILSASHRPIDESLPLEGTSRPLLVEEPGAAGH